MTKPENEVRIVDSAFDITPEEIRRRLLDHIQYTCYKDWRTATEFNKLTALIHVARDLAAPRMIATQRQYLDRGAKRVYYLSMEFLLGRILRNHLSALGALDAARRALEGLDLDIESLFALEPDTGLGNGGLGRLAACFLDSLATLQYPGYGYGLRYEHGMFKQEFEDGWQVEQPDDWLKFGDPWDVVRPEYSVPVLLYGRLGRHRGPGGRSREVWLDWQMIEGVPHDLGVPGTACNTVNILRLWESRAAEGFRIDVFNRGEYVRAVESENWAETVTKVLYPSDSVYAGKELRLVQEYFLCACAVRDIIRRFLKNNRDWCSFARLNAIHLNDTHPALAIVELMRFFADETDVPLETAWDIAVRSFAFTNHTLLPEALERWPVDLLQRVLPRHLSLIYEINHRFLQRVEARFPGDGDALREMSLIEEGPQKQVRMTHLAVVGSHSVNGVSELHSGMIRSLLLPRFAQMWPERFNNKTNGIAHRRWLLQSNPGLAAALTRRIGDGWILDLEKIRDIEPLAEDPEFRREFLEIKRENKRRLAELIRRVCNEPVDPDSLFDVHVKRLHEYKRQLLNALHILSLYLRIKDDPSADVVPRTFIFGAKAAPSYHIAKRIIKFINTMGRTINRDPDVAGRIKVVFLPDYRVSLAEAIIPAADLSEQISTAGMEASGTGNMKLSLNGALTIGTWDGANIEIAREVGEENIFIFGLRAEEVLRLRDSGEYRPGDIAARDPDLARTLEAVRENAFDPGQPDLFAEIHSALTEGGDHWMHVADFRAYADTQSRAAGLFRDPDGWAKKAILNVARMGPFSSDRTIRQYADQIWNLPPLPVRLANGNGARRNGPGA